MLVYAELFASLQDQPERRSANYIMLGGGWYTARWGCAADFASFASGVASCAECIRQMFSLSSDGSTRVAGSCGACVNWEIDVASGLLDYNPPEHYPPSELRHPNQKLRPSVITYDTLKEAIIKAHNNVVSGCWNADNAYAFLWTNGINKEARKAVIEAATNERKYNMLFNERDSNKEEFDAIHRLKELNPCSFQHWNFPALWSRGTELSQHVDVIMHLLFLGVIKATVKRVEDWMKSKGKYERFIKFVCGMLEAVQSLGIQWCKALPYTTGNFGGWVSENYLALARVLPWFYSSLTFVEGVVKPYVEPDGPPHKWTVPQNKYWLSSRNLPTAGLAKVLRALVAQYMNQEGGPLPVCAPATSTTGDITAVIRSLWCMVCNLMVKEVTEDHIRVVKQQIKCFLSLYDTLESIYCEKRRKRIKIRQRGLLRTTLFVCSTYQTL